MLLCFAALTVSAQDTISYKYVYPSKLTDKTDTLEWMIQYDVDDSVFVIEGLFDEYFSEGVYAKAKKNYLYQFKKNNNEWLMKYEADWKTFFNGKEEKLGSWDIRSSHMAIQWEKTNIIDGADTVYGFYEKTFYDEENPLIMIDQMPDGSIEKWEFTESIIDVPSYLFTFSSGVIAITGNMAGYMIRTDKMYLKDRISNMRLFKESPFPIERPIPKPLVPPQRYIYHPYF